MRMMAVMLTIMLASCSGAPAANQSAPATLGGVTLTAEKSGDDVRLTLANGSADPVGYNLCSSRLLQRTGDGWTNVPTGLICTMEIRTLAAGASDSFTHTLPAAAGEYRFETRVEIPVGESATQVASNSFQRN